MFGFKLTGGLLSPAATKCGVFFTYMYLVVGLMTYKSSSVLTWSKTTAKQKH